MIGIVDYKAGNLTSVGRALAYLGIPFKISGDPEVLRKCERVIFPGVGAARSAMENLKAQGLDEFLETAFSQGVPILGICLGMQIIMDYSEEDEGTKTLGLIPGRVRRFPSPLLYGDEVLKVPHMGWNSVEWTKEHPVFSGLDPEFEYYFVHSYFVEPQDREVVCGITFHGISFPSSIAYKNIVAVQFHPEKSGNPGLKILQNFSRWVP